VARVGVTNTPYNIDQHRPTSTNTERHQTPPTYSYEGTGLHGVSFVRRVDPRTGKASAAAAPLAQEWFGEGIALVPAASVKGAGSDVDAGGGGGDIGGDNGGGGDGGQRLVQLVYHGGVGFEYDAATLRLLRNFT